MRRARVRTTHDTPVSARIVARAVEPDNTESMTTRVDGDVVQTTIERDTTGGLHASVDDYVVNLTVADRLAGTANGATPTRDTTDNDSATGIAGRTEAADTNTTPHRGAQTADHTDDTRQS